MDTFNKLAEMFRSFPGIGPRQAKRFVYFLLSREPQFIEELSSLASALRSEIRQCRACFRYFQKRNGTVLCPICQDPNRSPATLMVVAKDTDLESMEKSGEFDGRYFVLGGTMPLLEAKHHEKLRVAELLSRIDADANSGALREVILALSANTEGEYTSDELRKAIAPLLSASGTKVTILGRGLSTGSELEYADKETLRAALKNRAE